MTNKEKIRVGITGESGFIGTRLRPIISTGALFTLVPFDDSFFGDEETLARFAENCDIIVHLAAMNRSADPAALYETNLRLTRLLICAMQSIAQQPGVIFASSIREGDDTAYGQSKKACREELEKWAKRNDTNLAVLRIPNVFGPDAKPFDNSFIATFCYQLLHGERPTVTENREIPLLYIDSLGAKLFLHMEKMAKEEKTFLIETLEPDFRRTVTDILQILETFNREFQESGQVSGQVSAPNGFSLEHLRETFLSYTS